MLHWGLACVSEFLVERSDLLCTPCWPDKVKVEKTLQDIEEPFRLPRLDVQDQAGVGALEGVSGEVADVADGIHVFGEVRGECFRGEHLVDLIAEVTVRDTRFLTKEMLEAPATECSAGLWAISQDITSLAVVRGEWLSNFRGGMGLYKRPSYIHYSE